MSFWEWLNDWAKNLLKKDEPAKVIPLPVENVAPTKLKDELPWMTVALGEEGEKEISGSKDNPRIIEYHSTTSLKASEDEVPWCSSFINWVFWRLGWVRTKSAAAKSWLDWGIKLKKPRYGCVAIKARTGGNHVTFYVRDEVRDGEKGWIGFGGNQGNKVGFNWYSYEVQVKGWRWPKEAKHLLKAEEIV